MIAFESLENKEANSGMTESEIIKYCVKAMDTYKFEYDTLYALDIMLQLGILEKEKICMFFLIKRIKIIIMQWKNWR